MGGCLGRGSGPRQPGMLRYMPSGYIFWIASLFPSAPAPKDRCYYEKELFDWTLGLVSILTRPEGRVLPNCRCIVGQIQIRFNPHPPRGTGATPTVVLIVAGVFPIGFQSSPCPEGRVLPGTAAEVVRRSAPVSILTRPEGRVLRTGSFRCGRHCSNRVSILTRPEGRVLRWSVSGSGASNAVSILTDPLGPVLPGPGAEKQCRPHVSILTDPLGPVLRPLSVRDAVATTGFNPHRPPEASATLTWDFLSFRFLDRRLLLPRCQRRFPPGWT